MERMVSSFDKIELFLNQEVLPEHQAVAVIFHGLCGHQGRYDYFAQLCHQANIGTYRYDHRGHGRSQGERGYLSDWNQLIDDANVVVDLVIAENPGRPVFLIGHSMGGFTVSLYCAKYPNKAIAGVVTSGALVRDTAGAMKAVPEGSDPFTRFENALEGGGPGEGQDLEPLDPLKGTYYTAGLCYALQAGLDWFADHSDAIDYPFFIAHGEKDTLVSPEDSAYLFKHIASKDRQLKIYGNLGHSIFAEYCKDEVIGDALRWITQRMR